MLALFVAAALAAPPAVGESPAARPLLPAQGLLASARLQAKVCKAAGRLQTSFAEPALLYREQDNDAGRLRRLIDLPPAEACLVGGEDHGR